MQKKALLLSLAVLFFTAVYAIQSYSDGEKPLPVMNSKIRSVSVFKNGLGFFIKELEGKLSDGFAVIENVPSATYGSLWFGSQDTGVIIEEVAGYKDETAKEENAISIEELLKANLGKKVTITYGGLNSEKTIEGIIKSIPDNREHPTPFSDQNNYYRQNYGGYPPYNVTNASIVIIDSGNGEVALNKSSITSVSSQSGIADKYIKKEKVKKLKIKTNKGNSPVKLTLCYLHKGINWSPGYYINIANPEKAGITMTATLVNDVEDIDGVDINFAVGYPNFAFSDMSSPMSLDESVTGFIRNMESYNERIRRYGYLSDYRSSVMTQQAYSYYDREQQIAPGTEYSYSTVKDLAGVEQEDLFFYGVKNLKIKKWQRSYYNVFSAEIPYKHIYEWNVSNKMNVDASGYYNRNQNPQEKKQEKEYVWHSVKLTNTTGYPWTTASAFVMNGWNPISQDMLVYTPKSSSSNLKLTMAMEIKPSSDEWEINRERDKRLYGSSYDLVTIQGELKAQNLKKEDITLEIRKTVIGDVMEMEPEGEVQKIVENIKAVNPTNSIVWEMPVKAGEEIVLKYKYQIYVYR